MVFRGLGNDDTTAPHPVPEVFDRTERRAPAQFTGGYVVDLSEQQRRHHQQAGCHDRFVRRLVFGMGGVERRKEPGRVRDDDDHAAVPDPVSRPTASATTSRTSLLAGVRPVPSKVREKRGSSRTRLAMAAR